MYNFDVYNYFLRLVPWFLRKPIFLAWIEVLATGLQFLVDQLGEFYDETAYFLQFNSQVIYLEQVLNEQFPDGLDGIYIETIFLPPFVLFNDIEAQPPNYFYNDVEAEDPVYLYNISDAYGLNIFIVWIPAALAGSELEIAAIVNLYALAGTTYTIQIIP